MKRRMNMNRSLLTGLLFGALALGGCSHWSWSKVVTPDGEVTRVLIGKGKAKTGAGMLVTEDDLSDRNYTVLGDINVHLHKSYFFFFDDPSKELVNAKLREKASELGADAVLLARYGALGFTFFSPGTLKGQGRAIRFED